MKTPRRTVILACGYGIVLGLYFGLVGIRPSPNLFDHCRPFPYLLPMPLFAVVLHSSKKLAARASWVAYLVCCLTCILTALAIDRSAIFFIAGGPKVILPGHVGVVLVFFGLSGFAAQATGIAARKWLLPSEERSTRMMNAVRPWLPVALFLFVTIHLAGRYAIYGRRGHSHQCPYGRESEHAPDVAVSLMVLGRSTSLPKGDLTVRLALYQDKFSRDQPRVAIMALANDSPKGVNLIRPHGFAQWLRVHGPDRKIIPLNEPIEWQLDCGASFVRIPAGGHIGFFVDLRSWFTLAKEGKHSVSLAWDGLESDRLAFTIGGDT